MFLRFARRQLAIWFVSALGFVILGIGIDRFVLAQQTGIKRTILITTDEPGSKTHEAVMGIAEVDPGASSGRHRHPGIEIGYVLEGSARLEHDGRPPIALKPGDVFRNDGVTMSPAPAPPRRRFWLCTWSKKASRWPRLSNEATHVVPSVAHTAWPGVVPRPPALIAENAVLDRCLWNRFHAWENWARSCT